MTPFKKGFYPVESGKFCQMSLHLRLRLQDSSEAYYVARRCTSVSNSLLVQIIFLRSLSILVLISRITVWAATITGVIRYNISFDTSSSSTLPVMARQFARGVSDSNCRLRRRRMVYLVRRLQQERERERERFSRRAGEARVKHAAAAGEESSSDGGTANVALPLSRRRRR